MIVWLIPVCHNSHWVLVFNDCAKKEVTLYDSLATCQTDKFYRHVLGSFLICLESRFEKKCKECNDERAESILKRRVSPLLVANDWKWNGMPEDHITQGDGVSCGVHTALAMLSKHFGRDPKDTVWIQKKQKPC